MCLYLLKVGVRNYFEVKVDRYGLTFSTSRKYNQSISLKNPLSNAKNADQSSFYTYVNFDNIPLI